MPRAATTMFGLLLVALSIGFNTARWPIVWQMVGPAMGPASANESAPETAAQPATPSPPIASAAPMGVKPVPDAERVAADDPVPPQADSSADSASAADENQPPPATMPEKPLVPVPQIRAAVRSAVDAGFIGPVRRLPPVDQSEPAPAARGSAPSKGSIPVYPSTGIE